MRAALAVLFVCACGGGEGGKDDGRYRAHWPQLSGWESYDVPFYRLILEGDSAEMLGGPEPTVSSAEMRADESDPSCRRFSAFMDGEAEVVPDGVLVFCGASDTPIGRLFPYPAWPDDLDIEFEYLGPPE